MSLTVQELYYSQSVHLLNSCNENCQRLPQYTFLSNFPVLSHFPQRRANGDVYKPAPSSLNPLIKSYSSHILTRDSKVLKFVQYKKSAQKKKTLFKFHKLLYDTGHNSPDLPVKGTADHCAFPVCFHLHDLLVTLTTAGVFYVLGLLFRQ